MEKKSKKIKALYIEPQRQPRIVSFEDKYENYRMAVRGDIEYCYHLDDAVIVVNAMGKIKGLTRNRVIVKNGEPIDIISGPFLIIGEEGKSLSKELIEKYKKLFEKHEYFFWDKNDPVAVLWGVQEGLMDEYTFKSPIDGKKSSVWVKRINPMEQFELLQVKDDFDELRFFPYDYLFKKGRTPLLKKASYQVSAYKGDLKYDERLDDIYERFNIHHPFDYKHPSLSIGDVIVLKKGRRKMAFFIDDIGFRELEDFFKQESN